MHRYFDASHSAIDAGAYQIKIDDEDDFDFTTTGFDFGFIIIEDLLRKPIRHQNKVPQKKEGSSNLTHNGVYFINGLKVAETTTNLPSGLYVVNGKIQWIP